MHDKERIERTLGGLIVWLFGGVANSGQRHCGEAASNVDVIYVLAIPALNGHHGGFGGQSGGANDNAGYSHEVRDIGRVKVADRGLRCRGA